MGRITGKVALVTGAAGGLGAAIAKVLATEGAVVVITDILQAEGEATAAAISKLSGACCSFMQQDVTDEARWSDIIDSVIMQYGALDILVNNAGIAVSGTIETETLEGWRKIQAINLDAVFMGTKQAIIAMREGGGSIINISSIEGLVGKSTIAAYNASKGGVRLLTKSAALYCAEQGYGVRVNSVHPGYILTDMVKRAMDNLGPEAWEKTLGKIPMGAMGEPDDIGYAVLFLASDESSYMTGSELVIDGGYTAQ